MSVTPAARLGAQSRLGTPGGTWRAGSHVFGNRRGNLNSASGWTSAFPRVGRYQPACKASHMISHETARQVSISRAACAVTDVVYLQRGPPIAENRSTTHRTHRTHGTAKLSRTKGRKTEGLLKRVAGDWLFIFLQDALLK